MTRNISGDEVIKGKEEDYKHTFTKRISAAELELLEPKFQKFETVCKKHRNDKCNIHTRIYMVIHKGVSLCFINCTRAFDEVRH